MKSDGVSNYKRQHTPVEKKVNQINPKTKAVMMVV